MGRLLTVIVLVLLMPRLILLTLRLATVRIGIASGADSSLTGTGAGAADRDHDPSSAPTGWPEPLPVAGRDMTPPRSVRQPVAQNVFALVRDGVEPHAPVLARAWRRVEAWGCIVCLVLSVGLWWRQEYGDSIDNGLRHEELFIAGGVTGLYLARWYAMVASRLRRVSTQSLRPRRPGSALIRIARDPLMQGLGVGVSALALYLSLAVGFAWPPFGIDEWTEDIAGSSSDTANTIESLGDALSAHDLDEIRLDFDIDSDLLAQVAYRDDGGIGRLDLLNTCDVFYDRSGDSCVDVSLTFAAGPGERKARVDQVTPVFYEIHGRFAVEVEYARMEIYRVILTPV